MHHARWLERFRQAMRHAVRVAAHAPGAAVARVSHGLPIEDVA